MNKEEILDFLNDNNIGYEIEEHKAVFTMEELNDLNLLYPKRDAKNLFIRDDKKKNYYLLTVPGDKKIDLKEFRKNNNTRNLSFASSEDLFEFLKLTPGSVSPLGILNDEDKKVIFYLDNYFFTDNKIIGVHPNDNKATIWIKSDDLINIIKNHGNVVNVVDM